MNFCKFQKNEKLAKKEIKFNSNECIEETKTLVD